MVASEAFWRDAARLGRIVLFFEKITIDAMREWGGGLALKIKYIYFEAQTLLIDWRQAKSHFHKSLLPLTLKMQPSSTPPIPRWHTRSLFNENGKRLLIFQSEKCHSFVIEDLLSIISLLKLRGDPKKAPYWIWISVYFYCLWVSPSLYDILSRGNLVGGSYQAILQQVFEGW